MSEKTASSLTETAYRKLRTQVLSAELKPGTKLKIADLAALFGVSASVIREALSRLVSEGMVVAEPQRGFRIAPLEPSEIKQLFEARIQIECICLADAIANADLAWEGRVVAALHELSKTPEESGQRGQPVSGAWLKAHANFHETLVSACKNPWFLRIRDNLYLHSERFRALALRFPTTKRDLRAEHEQIAQAALARDTASATALMTVHLKRTIAELTWETPEGKGAAAS